MRTTISMATSLVRSLFTGSEEADTILLEDTVDHSARPLLKCCAHHLAKRFSAVHLFLFDIDSSQWLSGLPQEVADKITVHDGFSDPLGWDADRNSSSQTLFCLKNCSAQSLIDSLGEKPPPLREDRAVVVDSLSSLLLQQSPAAVCRMIHALGRCCSVVVYLVHADLHQDHVTTQLRHVTSTSILVQHNDPDTTSSHSSASGLCSTTHKRKSGKVLRKMEQYSVSQSLSVLSTTDHHGSTPSASDLHEATNEPDPTANLTFDLHLSLKEKEERSKVVLPYTAARDDGMGVASRSSDHTSSSGGGQIYYQPDDVDDFDESDPDDDLDI